MAYDEWLDSGLLPREVLSHTLGQSARCHEPADKHGVHAIVGPGHANRLKRHGRLGSVEHRVVGTIGSRPYLTVREVRSRHGQHLVSLG